ncbi:pentapeptide repeat-containing protein [uncultured Rothia sp.]|uniref:pentapeptide repeat-containing protein n=1 Tax=uncultured Rothia sp. TaxID=316088 RepID=UPI00288A213D|nr:pentapeptide repeat-containing protein [uncultured Rothia sp.]
MTNNPNNSTKSQKRFSRKKNISLPALFRIAILALFAIAIILLFQLPHSSQSLNNISTASIIQTILAIISGAIGIFSLLETSKNIHKIEKAEEEHINQVHVERRNRHTNAKEQLTREDDVTRRNSIDILLNLVDEWLTDNTCTQEEQKKESQDIINTLCKYIQSIPLSYTKEDLTSGKYPAAEKEIRTTILKRINSRTKNSSTTDWSNFYYDFSNAFFFYSVNFSKCNFGHHMLFNNSTFAETASFSGTTFAGNAVFSNAVFKQKANFFRAYFRQVANFSKAVFSQDAYFSFTSFNHNVDFSGVSFLHNVDFSGVLFQQKASYREVLFQQKADFSGAFFKSVEPDFTGSSETNQQRTRFAALPSNQEAHSFRVSEGSIPILLGTTGLNAVKYSIPKGTLLFDPDSWDEKKKIYTCVSKPAEPLENLDTEEEKPTE